MKYLLFTSLMSLISVGTALAGERVNESITVKPGVSIDVEHVKGDITIIGWDKQEVEVVGELADKAKEFIFELQGDQVVIHVRMPKHNSSWNSHGGGDDLDIRVPRTSAVNYGGVNANAEIENLANGLKATTVNGSIEAKNIDGRIGLQSVNGDIDARNLNGDIHLETVNGRIKDRNSKGKEIRFDSVNGDIVSASSIAEITAETVNGGIELELGNVDTIEMVSVNGEIDIKMNLMDGGEVDGSTVSGRINLDFQKDVSAEFDVQGHAGGNLVNRITDDKVRKAKYGPGRWLEFEVNGGKAKVELSTVSGRIVLDTHNN